MQGNLSVQELQFKKVMGVLAILFFIALGIIAIIPEWYTHGVNFVAKVFGQPQAPVTMRVPAEAVWGAVYVNAERPANTPAKPYAERTHVAFTCTSLLLLTLIAAGCWINPRRYMEYIPVLLFVKLVPSIFSLGFYFFVAKYFIHLLTPILDVPLFVLILVMWLRAKGPAKAETAPV